MKRKTSFRMLLCVALSIFVVGYWAATAEAVPITYIFSGTGSGWDFVDNTLPIPNAYEINDVSFSIYLVGDTVNVIDDGFGTIFNAPLGGLVVLSGLDPGLGLGTTLSSAFKVNTLEAFVYQPGELVGFDDLAVDLFDVATSGAGLLTYFLTAPFGPIAGSILTSSDFFLNIGTLTFNATTDPIYFSAELGAAVNVPEPVSMLLLGFGLLGVSALRRRKS